MGIADIAIAQRDRQLNRLVDQQRQQTLAHREQLAAEQKIKHAMHSEGHNLLQEKQNLHYQLAQTQKALGDSQLEADSLRNRLQVGQQALQHNEHLVNQGKTIV